MRSTELADCLECFPIIAAIGEDRWEAALSSPAEVLFYLECNLMTAEQRIRQAHDAGKSVFIHIDLSEGIGKDRTGLSYLAKCSAGDISFVLCADNKWEYHTYGYGYG